MTLPSKPKSHLVLIGGKARAGKDFFAVKIKELLEKNEYKCQIVRFADLLKLEVRNITGWDGVKNEEGRSLLQYYGQAKREKDINYWAKGVEYCFEKDADFILVADFRHKSEFNYFKRKGYFVTTVLVERYTGGAVYSNDLTIEQQNHISEIDLQYFSFDIHALWRMNLCPESYAKMLLDVGNELKIRNLLLKEGR